MFGPKQQADAERFNDLLGHMERSANHLGMTIGQVAVGPLTKLIENLDSGTSKLIEFAKKWDELKDIGKAADQIFKPSAGMMPIPDAKGADSYAAVRERMKKLREEPVKEPQSLLDRMIRGGESANKKLEEKIKEGSRQGVEEGIKAAFERISLNGGGAGGARVWNASYGGGGIGGANRRFTRGDNSEGLGGNESPGGGGPAVDRGRMGGERAARRVREQVKAYTGDVRKLFDVRSDQVGEPGFSGPKNLTDLITVEARRAGVDPRIMEGIRAGESLHTNR
jgi:hypothetical protein